MFIEMQGGGGGGGGSYYYSYVVTATTRGGSGGGGGAYISMLVDLSKFSYFEIDHVGSSGGGGGKDGGNGGVSGNTILKFYKADGSYRTFTAKGGGRGYGGKDNSGPGSGGLTDPETVTDSTGIRILRYYYGKPGGAGRTSKYKQNSFDFDAGGSFIATDTRYFGGIVDSIDISGGNSFDSPEGWFGDVVAGGGGGAAALSKFGYGGGGHGGNLSLRDGYTEYEGEDGQPGVVFLYY